MTHIAIKQETLKQVLEDLANASAFLSKKSRDRAPKTIAAIKQALVAPTLEPMALADEVIGCFHAAECEGLTEALANTTDERLKDLVERRLMHALYAAQKPKEKT